MLEAEELEALASSGADRAYIPPQHHSRPHMTSVITHGEASITPHPHRTHIPDTHPHNRQQQHIKSGTHPHARVQTHTPARVPMSSFGARASDAGRQGGVMHQTHATSQRGPQRTTSHPSRPHQTLPNPGSNMKHAAIQGRPPEGSLLHKGKCKSILSSSSSSSSSSSNSNSRSNSSISSGMGIVVYSAILYFSQYSMTHEY